MKQLFVIAIILIVGCGPDWESKCDEYFIKNGTNADMHILGIAEKCDSVGGRDTLKDTTISPGESILMQSGCDKFSFYDELLFCDTVFLVKNMVEDTHWGGPFNYGDCDTTMRFSSSSSLFDFLNRDVYEQFDVTHWRDSDGRHTKTKYALTIY